MGAPIFSFGQFEISLAHILIGLILMIVAFVLGLSLKSDKEEPTKKPTKRNKALRRRMASDNAFLKGLNHLMADHTDKAIEEFTKAVTLNSNTVETYVVLANLFRQKGEIERAVRIRQNIVARPNIEPEIKLQAMFDLGMDYKKGGLLNRAAEVFAEVLEKDSKHVEACRQVVSLYEETKDWEKAFEAQKRLDRLTHTDHSSVMAHYKTERGKELFAKGKLDEAEHFLNQAIKENRGCLDAYLHLGDLEMAKQRPKKAANIWRKAVSIEPKYTNLVINRVTDAEDFLGPKALKKFLAEIDPNKAEDSTLVALARYYSLNNEIENALELLQKAIALTPKNLEAHRLRGEILLEQGPQDKALAAFEDLLDQLNGGTKTYQCSQCGHITDELTWKCPRCHRWDTVAPRKI